MRLQIMFINFFRSLGGGLKAFMQKRHFLRAIKDKRRVRILSSVSLTPEQKNQIDSLYEKNYGKRISYDWHRYFTAFTGKFDPGYLPEMMYIPAFERFENLWPAYCRVFEDKNFTPLLAARAGVKTPPVRISCAKGCFFDSAFLPLSREEAMARLDNAGEVFIKPSVDTGSGKNCMLANIQGGKDLLSSKPLAELLAPLGMDYTVQERLRCHESIAVLYAESVNTFRLISYRWKDEILFMPTILRIGSGGKHIDNAHAGGFFVGVLEDGKLTRSAFTEFRTEYERHPDTGICFAEHRIPLYPEVKAAARRMHEILPQIGVVNWDFTLDESGAPVLIEMNVLGGSPWMAEMAHGCGPFGDKLPEILRWLRLMENTKAADREQYAFGRGV